MTATKRRILALLVVGLLVFGGAVAFVGAASIDATGAYLSWDCGVRDDPSQTCSATVGGEDP